MEQGLNLNNGSRTVLSTSVSLGTTENAYETTQQIEEYQFGYGEKMNVIIAAPICVENAQGEKIFLGYPERNIDRSGQEYEEHCILDRICSQRKRIPPEFILGYCGENTDGSHFFVKNSRHYSQISEQERESLYEELSSNMDEVSQDINSLIATGNTDELQQRREKIAQLGIRPYLIDSAIVLAEKYTIQNVDKSETQKKEESIERITDRSSKQQTSSLEDYQSISSGSPVRRILINDTHQGNYQKTSESKRSIRKIYIKPKGKNEGENIKSSEKIRTRKILLGALKSVNYSDLTPAKEALREGIRSKEEKGRENYDK